MPNDYSIVILPRAQKELAAIAPQERNAITTAIRELAHNPRPIGCKKLRNRPGWRIRVGVYRVLYTVEDDRLVIEVFKIGHRSSIYR